MNSISFNSTLRGLLIPISLLLLLSTTVTAQTFKHKKMVPKTLKKITFGMSYSDVAQKRTFTSSNRSAYDFRRVYSEKISDSGIDEIVYYFDNEGDLPLYEFIITYDSEEMRDEAASKLLGTPNYKDGEWKFDSGKGYPILAWKFQKKLVIAAAMKGTEWEDEGT